MTNTLNITSIAMKNINQAMPQKDYTIPTTIRWYDR